MKGDLVFYDSLVWLMGSLEGLPACQGPQTSRQRSASAAEPESPQPLQPLHSPTSPCPSDQLISAPTVGKLHLPLRIRPSKYGLALLASWRFLIDPSLLPPISSHPLHEDLSSLPRQMYISTLLGTFCGPSLSPPGQPLTCPVASTSHCVWNPSMICFFLTLGAGAVLPQLLASTGN